LELIEYISAIRQQAEKEGKSVNRVLTERIGIDLPYNVFFYVDIFNQVITQVNAVEGGIWGINYNALNYVFNLYKLDDYHKYITFRIIRVMEEVYINYVNNKIQDKINKERIKFNNRYGRS